MRLELDGPPDGTARPDPIAPPGGLPACPEPLPVLPHQRAALYAMIREAVDAKLSSRDLEVVAYLIRRAHGMGSSKGSEE